MLRLFGFAALASICVLMTAPRADAGIMNAEAFFNSGSGEESVYATAFHGFIDGNDAIGDVGDAGDPLFSLLTAGTSTGTSAKIDGNEIQISPTGMFSTLTNQLSSVNVNPIVDVVEYKDGFDGYQLGSNEEWKFLGKSDDNPSYAFHLAEDEKEGEIVLNSPPAPLDGPFVLSLKAGNEYSVYLFEDVSGVLRFEFSLPKGLSHAALFQVVPNDTGVVPEPASLAIFGFGALLGVGGLRRRRKDAEKKEL